MDILYGLYMMVELAALDSNETYVIVVQFIPPMFTLLHFALMYIILCTPDSTLHFYIMQYNLHLCMIQKVLNINQLWYITYTVSYLEVPDAQYTI